MSKRVSVTVYRVRERLGEPDTFDLRLEVGDQHYDWCDCPVNKPVVVDMPDSAAPDLLAACKATLHELRKCAETLADEWIGPEDSTDQAIEQAEAAIAQAEGGPK
jgi:hypothetical protein